MIEPLEPDAAKVGFEEHVRRRRGGLRIESRRTKHPFHEIPQNVRLYDSGPALRHPDLHGPILAFPYGRGAAFTSCTGKREVDAERSAAFSMQRRLYLPGTRGDNSVGKIVGLPFLDIGRTFRCILPGHYERHPSASVWRRDDGTYHYHDFHGRAGVERLTLADAYAARMTGEVRALRGPELPTWKLRLLVRAGLAVPALVALPPLPTSAGAATRLVYHGFRLLLACKWLYAPGAPAPFSWRSASRLCGVSERAVGTAMHELLRSAIIRSAGTWKRTTLFLPGVRSAQNM